jgi:hypothetical protein
MNEDKKENISMSESEQVSTDSTRKRRLAIIGLLVFLSSLIIYYFTLNSVWASDHPTSFLQLDYAIWANHTLVLGPSNTFLPHSVDDFIYNGYYYSALAPGVPLFAFPFVVLAFFLDGHFTVYGNAMFLSELFVAITNAVASYLVYKIGRMYFGASTSVFLAFAYAFSTISWPFATFFFQSDPSAMFDLLAAYFALKILRGGDRRSWLGVFCGLALSAAFVTDYVNAILVPIILLSLVISLRGLKKPFLKESIGFVLAICVGVAVIVLYNYLSFGRPFVSSEQLYLNSSTPLGDFGYPLYLGLLLNLFTPFRGLFFYSPVLVIGVIGYWKMLRERSTKDQGFFLLALFLGILLPYSAWYNPFGGLSYGPRFIIPAIPFLLVPGGFVLEKVKGSYYYIGIYVLYVIGVATNGIAALTSALGPERAGWLSSPFLTSAFPAFVNGTLDSWWRNGAGDLWKLYSFLIIGVAAFLPIIADYLIETLSKRGMSKKIVLPTNSVISD